jgi:hypothetical protein
VTASLPGAAPAQLETDVARKIENAVATTQGLKHIYTKVQDGVVTITAEFRLEKPVQEAVDDVRSAVAKVRSDLPGDVREPIVTKMDLAGQPVLAFTVASPGHGRRSAVLVRGQRDRAQAAGRARRGRGQPGWRRQPRNPRGAGPVASAGAGRHAADISRQLRQVQVESAGGRTDLGGSEQPVRTLATVQDGRRDRPSWTWPCRAAAASSWTMSPPSATPPPSRRSAALLNGKPVVGFEVARSKGESEVTVGAAVQKALAELRPQHPTSSSPRPSTS